MSCPLGFGDSEIHKWEEIMGALSLTKAELLAYRDMPLDRIPILIKHKIPLVMVSGDSDKSAPYHENGVFIERAYKEAGLPFALYMKPGGAHHPHGLPDPKPIVEFIQKHAD
jgi:hypothetical protein